MALILTPLASDSFVRADAPNLGPNWGPLSSPLFPVAIVSNQAVLTPHGPSADSAEFYTAISFPADQYAQMTIAHFVTRADVPSAYVFIKTSPDGFARYVEVLVFVNPNGTFSVNLQSDLTTYYTNANFPMSIGDSFAVASVGTAIYGLHNGAVFATATYTETGGAYLGIGGETDNLGDIVLTNFVAGRAALPSSLGSGNDFLYDF